MDKILHVASTFKSHENDDGSVMIRGMASTDHSDRAGDVIAAEAWTKGGLENFKNNPVILFNHDYDKPIGRATGVTVTERGLEIEAKISKSAPAAVCELVKDGVLGAFSVGFKVKDADHIKETDGLMIKDAELFEVSVVSVPCNQAATFSLAKSFDSVAEYEEFKKTFTNRVDLTGQSLTKEDEISSNLVSDAPTSSEKSEKQEIKMDIKESGIDLEAFAKKVAEETAAKIAMKQAEQKAADEAEAKAAAEAETQKAAEQEAVKQTIRTGIETGAERLQADMEADFAKAKDSELAELTKKYEADVKEKQDELDAMRNSKRDFSAERKAASGDLTAFGKEFLQAKILGAITGKGYDTDYFRGIQKDVGFAQSNANGSTPATGLASIDLTVGTTFRDIVQLEQRVASLFQEIAVSSQATVLPVIQDASPATFATTGIANLGTGVSQNGVGAGDTSIQVILRAYRLIAGTFIDNQTDEATVINFLPMITAALARSHAKAMDRMCLFGSAATNTIPSGIVGVNGADAAGGFGVASTGVDLDTTTTGLDDTIDASTTQEVTASGLLALRQQMGRYGMNPLDVAYILPTDGYLQLIDGPGFTDISEVGAPLASKLSGLIGTIYGSPVIASDQLENNLSSTDVAGETSTAAAAVNVNNYVIPRLKGVGIETEYSAVNQRTGLIASQSVGFNQIEAGETGHRPAIRAKYV